MFSTVLLLFLTVGICFGSFDVQLVERPSEGIGRWMEGGFGVEQWNFTLLLEHLEVLSQIVTLLSLKEALQPQGCRAEKFRWKNGQSISLSVYTWNPWSVWTMLWVSSDLHKFWAVQFDLFFNTVKKLSSVASVVDFLLLTRKAAFGSSNVSCLIESRFYGNNEVSRFSQLIFRLQ